MEKEVSPEFVVIKHSRVKCLICCNMVVLLGQNCEPPPQSSISLLINESEY